MSTWCGIDHFTSDQYEELRQFFSSTLSLERTVVNTIDHVSTAVYRDDPPGASAAPHIVQDSLRSTALLSAYDVDTPHLGILSVVQVAATVLLPLPAIDTVPFQYCCHDDTALPAPLRHGAHTRAPLHLAQRAADWPVVASDLFPSSTFCQHL
ncbi:unnamed protein product, partial [Pylaiella littoralis]